MKFNEPVSGSPVVTPLKISSVLGQKLAKVEPMQKNDLLENGGGAADAAANDEDFDNSPDDDEDSTKDEDVALTTAAAAAAYAKENIKLEADVGEGGGSVGGGIVADGNVGGVDNDTAETEEESNAGGKKKGVRKKRSINWEEAERSLLVEVIKPKVDFVENKAVDAKSIKSKRMAWLHVTKQFNSLNFRHRSLEQIQVQWRSMKNLAKKEYQQKHPKSTASQLEGLQMLEFMEEMQKEPIMGGTRSQTRNSTIQNSLKKELPDDMEDEEEDTPLAALPNALLNHSNSEDTQPTSTLALPSPPTSAESHHLEYQQQQQEQLMEVNNIRMKKKKSLPKIKQKLTKTKSPLLSSKLQEKSSSGGGIGLKIKRQKCETSTSSSSLTDVSTTGIMLNSMSNVNTSYHTTDSKTANNTVSLTSTNLNTPPLSPPICLDEKYKKQLFDLIKRARLAEIDYARKEHEQKLRFEQQEQELKLRYMTEIHEQRMRFCLQEHEARMRVFATAAQATNTTLPASNNEI
ncbi:hypothetical protein CVS40_2904 [Lucilia cuprina]|nr:hypothetical protein CVS40_2904 [Lucilia cuprina]